MDSETASLTSPGIRFAIPPAIFLLCAAIAGTVHWFLFPGTGLLSLFSFRWHFWPGLVIGVAGFVFMMSAWFHFVFIGTTVTTSLPVNRMVENGVFRFSRNPMYVGFVSLLFAAAIALASLPYLVAAGAMFLYLDRYVIPREERYMTTEFGARYEDYRNTVRRWL